MDGRPVVAVIIPMYNREKFIGSAVKSVIWQDVEADVKIFVLDDLSTDNSYETISSWSRDFRRATKDVAVVRLSMHHGRPGAVRNLGILRARKLWHPDYITFLDADDIMAEDRLRDSLEYLVENPEAMVVTGNEMPFVEDGVDVPWLTEEILNCSHPYPMSAMCRTSLFDRADGFFNPTYFVLDDMEWIERLRRNVPIGHLDGRVLTHRRFHGDNLTMIHRGKMLEEYDRMNEEVASTAGH